MSNNKVNIFLLMTSVFSTLALVVGITFSYFNMNNMSKLNALAVEAGKISLGLGVTERYTGHVLIPLNDEDIDKAYQNKCLDSYGWGACLAYNLTLSNYHETQEVEALIDFELNDVENLSYMVIDSNGNRIKDITHIDSANPSSLLLMDSFVIADGTVVPEVKEFTLLIWLTNIKEEIQDEDDAGGSFTATVTFKTTYGGRLTATVKGIESESELASVIE